MTVLIIVVAVFIGLTIWTKIYIGRHYFIESNKPPEEVVAIIGDRLGMGWKTVSGSGAINVMPGALRAGPKNRPTFSVSVDSDPQGSTCELWASRSYGVMSVGSAVAYRRLRKHIEDSVGGR